jgi:class 3 adenylate cyclase
MSDVRQWLVALGLEQYAKPFDANDIDWDVLPELDHGALKDIGVDSIGHRLRILKAARLLGTATARDSTDAYKPSQRDSPTPSGEAERRQLTVLFCDIVGSTPLAQRLDPEQLRDVIRAYQNACAGAVSRYDGYVAQFLGDGVVVYFGFPRAHEDDAERAGHAALELLSAVPRLPTLDAGPLQIRIGIATGTVVVGDLVGEGATRENMVLGDTPNLAARLQSVAKPGTVLISESSKQLAGDRFAYEEVQVGQLKGFAEPIRAWRIVDERRGQSRFGVRHASGLSGFFGREQEVGLLLDRWRLALHGEGQVVLLAGEAGIGKSRIVEALRERIAGTAYRTIRHQCSPYHTGSPFYPVIQQIEFAAGINPDDSGETKLAKLDTLLQESDVAHDTLELIAGLLSIPAGAPAAVPNLSPQAQRQRTLLALLRVLEGLAARSPVLFIIEDAHWIDPSTAEMLELIINRLATLPVLLVVTARPDFAPPWTSHAHCTVLTLNRLSRESCMRLIAEAAAGRGMPSEMVEQILAKTDGVPLFVEELTKTILELDLLTLTDQGYVLSGPLLPLAIPATLQDSLMARLDERPEVKEVAQLAAVIGRQFSHTVLSAIAKLTSAKLDAAIEELLRAGLIFRRGTGSDASYEFKHALVRDIAYQSLLKSKRAQHHAAIARMLEEQFSALAERESALLAHHFTEAGLISEAIDQWRRAGAQAFERSAINEAAVHFTKALSLLATLDPGKDRHQLELALRIDYGPVLMAKEGFASKEVTACYERARALCELTGDRTRVFPATWGLWYARNHVDNMAEASRLADELIVIGNAQSDPGLLLEAYHSAWTSSFRGHDLKSTYEFASKGIELYQPDKHHRHTYRYGGHDPGVCGRMVGATAQCLRGYADEALALVLDAVALAERLGHQFSLAFAVSFSATIFLFRRDPQETAVRAQWLRTLAEKHGFPFFAAMGSMLSGWAMAAQGEHREGLQLMEHGLDASRRLGIKRLAFQLGIMAEAYGWSGEFERAYAALAAAQKAVAETEEYRWEAEVYRVLGDLQANKPNPALMDAETAYRRAIEIAAGQEAKLFEFRAAIGLARRLGATGRSEEAQTVLSPLVQWFSEGAETAELRDARALLGTLR